MDTWWSPAATRREARPSRRADAIFVVVVADLPDGDRGVRQQYALELALDLP